VRRLTTPLVIAAALFVAAGGYVHLREWLEGYRNVPVEAPGAAVVRVGFVVNAAASFAIAAALVVTQLVGRRLAPLVMVGAALSQVAFAVAVVVSRTGSLGGWQEPVWTRGASQSLAVEIGALVALAAVASVALLERRRLSPALA
jgi:hypothetical protein